MPLEWAGEGTVSAPFSPSDLADMWEWWEPNLEGYADGDPITILTGQVAPGSGHNWIGGSGTEPDYLTNQINGLGAADFLASAGEFLSGVDPSALTAAQIFLIIKGATPTQAGSPWDFGTSASVDVYAFSDNHIYAGLFSNTRRDVGDPSPALTDWNCVEVVSTSSEWTFLLNGTQMFTTGTNTVASPSSCALAASSSAGGLRWNGLYAGIYICSAELSSGDRLQLVNYLNNRFDLSIV